MVFYRLKIGLFVVAAFQVAAPCAADPTQLDQVSARDSRAPIKEPVSSDINKSTFEDQKKLPAQSVPIRNEGAEALRSVQIESPPRQDGSNQPQAVVSSPSRSIRGTAIGLPQTKGATPCSSGYNSQCTAEEFRSLKNQLNIEIEAQNSEKYKMDNLAKDPERAVSSGQIDAEASRILLP